MASSATSRAGSYIKGTSRCRNAGDLICPSACATSRRAATAVCRVSSASVRSAFSAARTSCSAGLSASAAAAVTTSRGSRSSRYGRITPTACSPRVAASAATAAARTSGCSSLSIRSMPFRPPRLHVGACRFERAQRPGADSRANRGGAAAARSGGACRAIRAGRSRRARARAPDGPTPPRASRWWTDRPPARRRLLRPHVLDLETAAEDDQVAALGTDAPRTSTAAIIEARPADLLPGERQPPGLDQHEQKQARTPQARSDPP